MRGLLLAASLPEDTNAGTYWNLFESSAPALTGLHVHDPFAGGGSTLVEAARLGASVSGTDVDPLAVELVKHEIESVDEQAFGRAARPAARVPSAASRASIPWTQHDVDTCHYFYLHEVTCPNCAESGPLYKDLVIARRSNKAGAEHELGGTPLGHATENAGTQGEGWSKTQLAQGVIQRNANLEAAMRESWRGTAAGDVALPPAPDALRPR